MGALLSLGSFAGCIACGICSCCVGKSINLCCYKFECNHSHGTRIGYFILFFITSALALIFGNWGAPSLYKLKFIEKCASDSNSLVDGCFGDLIIIKIIFGGVMFHLLQFILTIGVKDQSDKRASIQNGFWPLKFFILIGLIIASVFIPNPFFLYYVWVSFICAGLFIIYQLILIVDFAHKFNDYLVGQLEEDRRCLAVLLSGTVLFFAISLVLNLIIWILFSKGASCKMNIGFSVSNFIICIIISIISITPSIQEKNEYSSSIFTSSVVTLYTSYLIWSAIFSEPESLGCVAKSSNDVARTISVVIGAIITLFAVAWSTVNAASNEEGKELTSAISGNSNYNDEEGGEEDKLIKGNDDDDLIQASGPVEYNYALFHLIFAFGYMYMACLLTNWRLIQSGDVPHSISIDESIVSVWIKVVSSWLTLGLYLWTIINSCVCPDRKFR